MRRRRRKRRRTKRRRIETFHAATPCVHPEANGRPSSENTEDPNPGTSPEPLSGTEVGRGGLSGARGGEKERVRQRQRQRDREREEKQRRDRDEKAHSRSCQDQGRLL